MLKKIKKRGTYTHYSTQADEHYFIISLLYVAVSLYINKYYTCILQARLLMRKCLILVG